MVVKATFEGFVEVFEPSFVAHLGEEGDELLELTALNARLTLGE